MANAKDLSPQGKRKILVLGHAGSGKTSQLLTLPGKKFAYIFDPNGLAAIRGHDIEYEFFPPDPVPFDVRTLRGADKGGKGDAVMYGLTSSSYVRWEKDVAEKLKSGYFQQFDVIAFDSCTTLLDLILDRLLTLAGRAGQWPQQDDWGPQMIAFQNIMRTFTGLDKTLYVTGHICYDKDEHIGRIFRLPMMTGRLRDKIPLLFSDLFIAIAEGVVNPASGGQGVKYLLQTVPDTLTPIVRTTLRGLSPYVDVTIDWTKPVVGQGLGGLLSRAE